MRYTPTRCAACAGASFHHWDEDGAKVGSPTSITITMNGNDTLTAVYATRKSTSGTVTTRSGRPSSGATITFSGCVSPYTMDANGNYTASVYYGWTGSITPSKSGCTFNLPNRSFSIGVTADLTGKGFTGTCSGA